MGRLEGIYKNVSNEIDNYGRTKENDQQKFASVNVNFDWEHLTRCKHMTIEISKR